ncbi:MAG: heavy-metal-associated domain-containing protein [Clostridium sp.]|nr:heavy-metal-associated domain-containing protein [Clostridium sp.]
MTKYILNIDGMMCGHCEAHMNDTIRNNFSVKKVESSHAKKQCVIIAEELDEDKLKRVVADTGYELMGIEKEPYEKKGLFSKLKK